jgi:hypothetical protein
MLYGTSGRKDAAVFQNSEMPEHQLLERIKDDILILGTYLQEKQCGEVPGITQLQTFPLFFFFFPLCIVIFPSVS